MFSNRVRIVVKCWLMLSVAVFFVRLGPVMARYRVAEQKFADLDFEAKRPAAPVIVNDPDSPVPRLTLALEGRAIEKLDDGHLPWVQATLPNRDSLYLVADRKGYFARLRENRVAFEFPRRGEESDDLYGVAVASESQIMATVGRHTVVQFWNAWNGELLATVEDEHPTIAARPETVPHSKRHPSNLHYQDAGARHLVASPTGCLFAIGKVDGTIELWGDLIYRDHPELISEGVLKRPLRSSLPRKFGLLQRRKVHAGRVVDLTFCKGGLQLLSVSGSVVSEDDFATDGVHGPTPREVKNDSTSDLVLSSAESLDEMWRQPLPNVPSQIAVPISEVVGGPHWRSENGGGIKPTRSFAIGMLFDGVIVGDLLQKEITGAIKFPASGPSVMVQSVAFHRNENALLTLHTSYSGVKENVMIETVLSLWQTSSRRRIATARLAGQFMSAGWDNQGTRLALLRYNSELTKTPPGQASVWPWSTRSTSPFLFHVWDVRAMPIASSAASN